MTLSHEHVATTITKVGPKVAKTMSRKKPNDFTPLRSFALFVVVVSFVVCSIPISAQLSGRPTRPQVQPPQGAVRQVIFQNCVSCHGIDDYAFFALDKSGWKSLIETKHKDMKVAIADADREILVDWLVTKFGPGTKPFPRTYVAPEITTFFSDAEAQTVLNRSCSTACHTLDRVNDARFSPDRWRVVTVDMRERGARLTDEELERLVEWLGRVKGTNPNQ